MIAPKKLVTYDMPLPILFEVIATPRALTMRAYEELIADSDRLIGRVTKLPANPGAVYDGIGKHARLDRQGAEPGVRAVIDGATLAPRFDGRLFADLGAASLNMDATDGILRGAEWADNGLWVFPVGLSDHLRPLSPFNHICDNVPHKATPPRTAAVRGTAHAMFLHVPFRTYDVAGSSLVLRCNPDYGYIGNVELTEAESSVIGTMFADLELVSGGGTIEADDTSVVIIRVVDRLTGELVADAECDIYLEATGGYLPRSRVRMTNGQATFRVMALGLLPGEVFKVKVGFRLFSGVLDVHFEVV